VRRWKRSKYYWYFHCLVNYGFVLLLSVVLLMAESWCIDAPCVWRIANRNATVLLLLHNNICNDWSVTTPRPSITTPKRPKITTPRMLPQFTTPRNSNATVLWETTACCLVFTTPPTPPSGQLQPTLPTTSLKLRSTTPSRHNQFASKGKYAVFNCCFFFIFYLYVFFFL
jgi:hypothetical protein